MEKKDILSAAQKEVDKGKEYDNRMTQRSYQFGAIIALFVGGLLFILEYLLKKSINLGLLAVCMVSYGSQEIYDGTKNKKIHLIIFGVIQLLIAVFSIIAFIVGLVQ